jgi:hypothetical protein
VLLLLAIGSSSAEPSESGIPVSPDSMRQPISESVSVPFTLSRLGDEISVSFRSVLRASLFVEGLSTLPSMAKLYHFHASSVTCSRLLSNHVRHTVLACAGMQRQFTSSP